MLALFHTVALAATLLGASAALASTVYRWVDEQGRVHYSDVVPEQYRDSAKPVNAAAAEPPPDQLREAQESARRETNQTASPSSNRSAPGVIPKTASAASAPSKKRPVQVPNDRTDCVTWQRLYEESMECFGPFRTVGGGMKPEAFEACNVVPAPPSRCRTRIP